MMNAGGSGKAGRLPATKQHLTYIALAARCDSQCIDYSSIFGAGICRSLGNSVVSLSTVDT